jgi:hypothetical protein
MADFGHAKEAWFRTFLSLRHTSVTPGAGPVVPRPRFNPVRLFVDMTRADRFWCLLFLLTLTLSLTERLRQFSRANLRRVPPLLAPAAPAP